MFSSCLFVFATQGKMHNLHVNVNKLIKTIFLFSLGVSVNEIIDNDKEMNAEEGFNEMNILKSFLTYPQSKTSSK